MDADSVLETLLPQPRSMQPGAHAFALPTAVRIDAPARTPAVEALERTLVAAGVACGDGAPLVRCRNDAPGLAAEGYRLVVDGDGARVEASDAVGVDRGLSTLTQLVAGARDTPGRSVPGVRIDDGPTFARRGWMLDVSRDRVPTMETLYALVDRLAAWKGNELQLYVEHTFAYRGHEEVWRGTGALTAAELIALDAYCAARHVRLVPNQQCFGHLHHWLRHARYRPLAECPDGVEHPFLGPGEPGEERREPFSLCPTDPASLEFVEALLDELLPLLRADEVNVGCDETFDLGLGRSRAACAERGVGRVYLDYLRGLATLCAERGKSMQVWADILLHHPELVPELPENVVPLLWGYEADHPFAQQTRVLAASGLPYYVCPGTSSWQSLAGRLGNATRNIAAAVEHARGLDGEHGARGVLVTDWGDRGHLQPLAASWIGLATAADLSWNADADTERRTADGLATLLSRHVFDERTTPGGAGRALVRLAGVAESTGAHVPNASPLSVVLTRVDEPFPPPELDGATAAGFERALTEIDAALAALRDETMRVPDRVLQRAELLWIAGVLRLAALLALQRLHAGAEVPVPALAADVRAPLAAELAPLIEEHRRLWCARSRRGGLERSCAWLERVLRRLEAP